MTQKSFFWDGVKVGDANTWTPKKGYHASDEDFESPLIDLMFRALWNGTGNRGVLYGWGNNLQVTGIVSPVSVNTGATIVHGLFYENTAASTVVVPTPNSETRIDRIVVRRDWANTKASLVRLGGAEGGTAPAMVQSPRTFYDVPLAQVSIDIAGNITVTDEREYCAYSTAPIAGSIGASHVVNESIDQAARSTREEKFLLGLGELNNLAQGWPLFTLFPVSAVNTPNAIHSYITGAGGTFNTYGTGHRWLSTFRVPPNLAGTVLTPYVWWSVAGATAVSLTMHSAWQMWSPNGAVTYCGTWNSTAINGTYELGQFVKTALKPVTGLVGGEMVYYWSSFHNPTGVDWATIKGIEFVYTGYTP